MAKGSTRKPYKLHFTSKELHTKTYRKYLYPQEIDGIVFDDPLERKLSESSWFRCLPPAKQIVVEKQLRLRVKGEYNHPILHYEDKLNEAALGFAKPVLLRLTETLTPPQLRFFMQLLPYLHINDGMLRNKDRQLFNTQMLWESNIAKANIAQVFKWLNLFDEKRLILLVQAEKLQPETKDDLYLSIQKRLTDREKTAIKAQLDLAIYINPFVVFNEQYIDEFVMPYFVNSAWYVINPYADRINAWITHNCN